MDNEAAGLLLIPRLVYVEKAARKYLEYGSFQNRVGLELQLAKLDRARDELKGFAKERK